MNKLKLFSAVIFLGLSLVFLQVCAPMASLEAGKARPMTLIRLMPENVMSAGAIEINRLSEIESLRRFMDKSGPKDRYDEFLAATGIDPLKDVHLVVFGSTAGLDQKNPDFMVIINLKHDPAKTSSAIRNFVPDLTEEMYRDVLCLTGFPPLKKSGIELKPMVAFLDGSNVVAGGTAAVKSVIDVFRKEAPPMAANSRLSSIIKKIDGSPLAWSASLIPAELVTGVIASYPALKIIEGLQGMALSFDYQNRTAIVQIIASGGTEQQNKDLAGTLTGLKMLGASSLSGQPAIADLVNSIEISSGRDYVRIYASQTEDDITKLKGEAASLMESLGPYLDFEKLGKN